MIAVIQIKTKAAQLVQIDSLHPLSEAWEIWMTDLKTYTLVFRQYLHVRLPISFRFPLFLSTKIHIQITIPDDDNIAEVFWILFLISIWLKLYCRGPISTLRNDCSLNPVNSGTERSIYRTQAPRYCTGREFEIRRLTFNMDVLCSALCSSKMRRKYDKFALQSQSKHEGKGMRMRNEWK